MNEDQKENSRLLSIGVFSSKEKKEQIPIALEENERDEKMTDGQKISFKDIRKAQRHAVSKCQRGEEWRR